MKCYWCIKEFRHKRRKILNVKEAITIYDGKGLCAKHLKAVESATQAEKLADFSRTQRQQQAMALSGLHRKGLEIPPYYSYGSGIFGQVFSPFGR